MVRYFAHWTRCISTDWPDSPECTQCECIELWHLTYRVATICVQCGAVRNGQQFTCLDSFRAHRSGSQWTCVHGHDKRSQCHSLNVWPIELMIGATSASALCVRGLCERGVNFWESVDNDLARPWMSCAYPGRMMTQTLCVAAHWYRHNDTIDSFIGFGSNRMATIPLTVSVWGLPFSKSYCSFYTLKSWFMTYAIRRNSKVN